ncbi:hypothetical protein F5B22DRAFT_615091 [Xylaria bambusicola]|uniref:uncharacterized protein n=1 Tax=Xylaria bambusicola TaxID=326684 RepID=UPI0020084747|nr:uncharacterized protein F5B22DRAFT_615091 [Xylaria bambusicola]KAI0512504.1 hypothetical protein F5B22DRAFT_615091 [Xylaria bambusicola]
MSPPLPLPSKAAVRALRSIALGTSCAIGAILEDRRRRISTLKTAVANKEKLKSSRHYHQYSLEQPEQPLWSLDDASLVGPSMQWSELESYRSGKHYKVETTDLEDAVTGGIETRDPVHDENIGGYIQLPQPTPSPSLPPPPASQQLFPPNRRPQYSVARQSTHDNLVCSAVRASSPSPTSEVQKDRNDPLPSIENLLVRPDSGKLDRAVSLFLLSYPKFASGPQRDAWLALSVRLSQECESWNRWEDSSRLLAVVIKLDSLTEAQYLAYNPGPIIEFLLRPSDPDTLCSEKNVDSAAEIFLAELKDRQVRCEVHMERIGWLLLHELLSSRHFTLAIRVYWRILRWAENTEQCASLAIQTFHQHNNHKAVIKIFLLHYSRLEPVMESFDKTMDYVLKSVEGLEGLSADSIVNALVEMKCSRPGKLQSRWIVQLLRAYWTRSKNIASSQKVFEDAVSLGLLDKVDTPEVVYRSMVEIAVQAGDAEVAHWYADKVIHDHPNIKHEITLKLVVLKAMAGDWNGVLSTFQEARASQSIQPDSYDSAFTVVLKIFAESNSASDTQEFVMLFVRDMGVRFHPHTVTLVAKRYGQTRDMKGLLAWLELCSQHGFALDAGFSNSVLHSCWAKWEMSFPELRMVYAKIKALNPRSNDEVTRRIMSQAAHRSGKGFANVRPGKMITVNKLAYIGRWSNQRNVLEAMNQELMDSKPTTAVSIYKRARRSGMPFSSHCLRLAVLAALQAKNLGAGPALSLIQDAHAQGHEVEPAVAVFLKQQIGAFFGSPEDVIIHMRNLISGFESAQIAIAPAVLTHMATTCVKIGQPEKAIALCHMAKNRTGSSHLCFSRQSFKALASAYFELLDIVGMSTLIDDLCKSEFSADKSVLLHLKSIRRLANKLDESHAKAALLKVIEDGVQRLTQSRAEIRSQGKLISHRTLEIIDDAVNDLQAQQAGKKTATQSCTVAYQAEEIPPPGIVQHEVAVG